MMNHFYIISGPNGAGKTTASFTILPDILDCKEFINADQIASGLSPFNLVNLITLYLPICDNWVILNGQDSNSEVIAYKKMAKKEQIINKHAWESILKQSK
ncbi:hypothetical protein [Cardinium endosymbiont of Nabis limbatus]|uniref:hypothetical protein n=1 Tax=Cardinium endosymbiont of Nabis limbatus TaxID=3066217 RepID=UPI003AF3F603